MSSTYLPEDEACEGLIHARILIDECEKIKARPVALHDELIESGVVVHGLPLHDVGVFQLQEQERLASNEAYGTRGAVRYPKKGGIDMRKL
jgi:hypothetical protein